MATNIATSIELGSAWAQVDLGQHHSFYIAGIKEPKGVNDTIDPVDVRKLIFEIGIDMGLEEPLTLSYITLDFDTKTSSNATINNATALLRCDGYPSQFSIRPTQIYTRTGILTEGTVNIDVNLQPVTLR